MVVRSHRRAERRVPREAPNPARRPQSEGLEPRVLFAAVRVWDGGSAVDANWTTAANWVGDTAPSPGDDLLFPAGAARPANTNDFAAGTAFNSIAFTASGYN